jgi:hypothetical protein
MITGCYSRAVKKRAKEATTEQDTPQDKERLKFTPAIRACGGSPPHERLRSRNSRHLQCCPFGVLEAYPPVGTTPGVPGGELVAGYRMFMKEPLTRTRVSRYKPLARNCRISAAPRPTSKSTRASILCAGMSGASGAPPMPPKNAKRNEKDRKRRADGLLRHPHSTCPLRI